MDPRRVAARRSVDYPKPESDLAEWATKIKALQRQVDADEEAEQKRLEAEIVAARQARLRRSRQFSGRGLNLEASPSRVSERLDLASPSPNTDISFNDRSRDNAERAGYQNDTLKKLMGSNAVHVPAKAPTQPVSLAAFMGGTATGPRLNRHAAQHEAHDPTQFTQPDTSAPHPIFGRGGVAMPGMVTKQDLNGGRIAPKTTNVTTASSFQRADEQSKSNTLRTPTVAERRRSISPTPVIGTEDFERYRPSVSPTPKVSLKSKKSSDSIKERSGRDTGYRSSIAETQPLRSQKSTERFNSPSLRSQKSTERIPNPTIGSEDFERYRPSTSPQPYLKTQKSFNNISSTDTPEKRRPVSSSGYASGRSSPEKRPISPFKRTDSPEKSSGNFEQPIPRTNQLKTQKSWVRDPVTSTTPSSYSTAGIDTYRSTTPRQAPAWTPPVTSSKVASYLTPTREATRSTPSLRERTISTPSYLPQTSHTSFHVPPKSNVVASPALARPIQPEPRLPSNAPVLPPAAASPAFMRLDSSAKDLSPSISRLQGRGFVQNMVKASLQLETTSSAPSSAQSTPSNKSRTGSGGKKSVLDRWQPQMRSASPPSPTKPQTPSSVRRAVTTDPKQQFEQPSVARPAFSTPPVQSAKAQTPVVAREPLAQRAPSQQVEQRPTASRPAFSAPIQTTKPATPSNEPLTPSTTARFMERMTPSSGKIGSATTMFVEKPATPSVSAVDEHGVRHEIPIGRLAGRDKHHITSEIPAPTGKPLIHPTKERVKRPKKTSIPTGTTSARLVEPEEGAEKVFSEKVESQPPKVTTPRFEDLPKPFAAPVAESKVGRLRDDWSSTGPILPHPDSTPAATRDSYTEIKHTKYPGLRQALPGMAKEIPAPPKTPEPRITPPSTGAGLRQALPGMVKEIPIPPRTPEPKLTPPSSGASQPKVVVPSSPSRGHSRIPSTGNRATVMEVAQALHDHANSTEVVSSPVAISPTIPTVKPAPVEVEAPPQQPRVRPPSTATIQSAEKRRSSYDRYSVVTLPPLKEEATPAPSPANTLTRVKERVMGPETKVEPVVQQVQNQIVIEDDNLDLLPEVDVSIMFQPIISTSLIPSDSKTISVDILSISGSASTSIPQGTDIFHDTEILAIVHRAKSSGGLVDTFVWCWIGKRAQYGEKEEKKVQEIARRYGTMPVFVRQYSEPTHLVELIGGRLIVCQGSRAHWSSENTTMHLVRSVQGVVYIDEHDLSSKNLCSAFSYCVTILGTVYIWHGHGSTPVEQEAATRYAEALANGGPISEIYEGKESEDDAEDMFWMIIGNDAFASADYWKWRGSSPSVDPTIWRVDASKKVNTISRVEFFSQEASPWQSVYIANCVWELFVLVGVDARSSRRDIKLALNVALDYAERASSARPFTPNVHVVIFPSQLPLDLRLHFRDIDETLLNHGEIPDHMNLVSSADALAQLHTTVWKSGHFKDHKMLPLGIDASSLPANALQNNTN